MSVIVIGQAQIAAGMASVLSMPPPVFTMLVLAVSGDERPAPARIVGVVCGLAGVRRSAWRDLSGNQRDAGHDTVRCRGAQVWAALGCGDGASLPAFRAAGCGDRAVDAASGVMMAVLAATIEQPQRSRCPARRPGCRCLGWPSISHGVCHILFFQILERSGATNVMLVTLLVPVTAILLGTSCSVNGSAPRRLGRR